MTNWKYTIKIGDIHKAYENEEISICEMAQSMKKRLLTNRIFRKAYEYNPTSTEQILSEEELYKGMQAVDVLNCFEDLTIDPNSSVEEYDWALTELYEFADRYRIWVDSTR